MADGNITVNVSTQDAQKRLLYLHRENARLRRRIMADAVNSDAAAASVAKLAQSLAEARAEIDRLRGAALALRGRLLWLDQRADTSELDALLLGPNARVQACAEAEGRSASPGTKC